MSAPQPVDRAGWRARSTCFADDERRQNHAGERHGVYR